MTPSLNKPSSRGKVNKTGHLVDITQSKVNSFPTPSATTKTLHEILLKHRSDAFAIARGESNGKDIGTSAEEAIAAINHYTKEAVVKELESLTGHANEIPEHVIKYRIESLKGGIDE